MLVSFKKSLLMLLVLTPFNAWAQNMPIEMIASNQTSPPSMRGIYGTVGYWDVDDWTGNDGTGLGRLYEGLGTHQISPNHQGGGDMASLGVDMSNLHKITDLNIHASNDSVRSVRYELLQRHQGGDVVFTNSSSTEYIVGIWDVDGGGGYGNDRSSGSYAMTLSATLGTRSADRKLVNLFLIASNRKSPTLKEGYEIIGYWDVDKGGARGTDDSSGSYMMTLLAKWN